MENSKVLIFDIEAPFGFFKISEVTRATVSFPFTRTALIGLIGAILGKERNSYWDDDSSLSKSLIALEIIKPIKHMGFTVNYSHTKYVVKIARTLSTYLPSQTGKGRKKKFISFVTNVRLDYLRDIHYRIYFSTDNTDLYEDLKKRLINSDFHYPPYIGHANLLADILYIGESKVKEMREQEPLVDSVIAIDYLDPNYLNVLDAKCTIIKDIPISMHIINSKITHRDTTGFLIQTNPKEKISIKLKQDTPVYNINNPSMKEDVLNWPTNTQKKILFMPYTRSDKNYPSN
ncbi:MAG: CRISPR-associated protein Cas5 [Promethearchaeota archaeon]